MRKVKARVYEGKEWKEVFGLFHQWAAAMEESREGFGNYTYALIELADGKIVTALPDDVQFLDTP
jgi:hypothetical protein